MKELRVLETSSQPETASKIPREFTAFALCGKVVALPQVSRLAPHSAISSPPLWRIREEKVLVEIRDLLKAKR
ncbi:hypothetical protein [Pedosphaera parvula]|uniref:Uncharacterized protein n=1 Tax=Pedosphaera parvula (strain Ellin514) TaxID=320771 RepID=B9XEU9_PEDPL|nr:hypothetical protein [Pedosphaera parvula]EEF61813.1 hypothetical protein Cflav_PD4853 [Pedosphaera parvula Ellin514]